MAIDLRLIPGGIKSGMVDLHPFAGPVVGLGGGQIIPAGQALDDTVLAGMSYYVKSVDGSLPRKEAYVGPALDYGRGCWLEVAYWISLFATCLRRSCISISKVRSSLK